MESGQSTGPQPSFQVIVFFQTEWSAAENSDGPNCKVSCAILETRTGRARDKNIDFDGSEVKAANLLLPQLLSNLQPNLTSGNHFNVLIP